MPRKQNILLMLLAMAALVAVSGLAWQAAASATVRQPEGCAPLAFVCGI